MTLTKDDLQEIDKLLVKRVDSLLIKRLSPMNKGLNRIEKKFDELFNFLDRKYVQVKREIHDIQEHLHLPVSDF